MNGVTRDRGKFKSVIKNILFQSPDLLEILCGEDVNSASLPEKKKEFDKKVKSHLFVDDTLIEKETLVFFDVVNPDVETHLKECNILMYCVCHRDLLDDTYFKDGYYGNRADILAEIVEDAMLAKDNRTQFGIGDLLLERADIYNSKDYYGVTMVFSAECFR